MSTSQYYIVGNNVSDTSRTRSSVGAFHSQHVVDYFALMRRDDREMIFTGSGADNHWPAHVRAVWDRIESQGIDRDRGTSRDATPPTPPGIRVRTTAVRSS